MIVIAAQREAELYPVLRKRNDSSALNRKEIGVVNEKLRGHSQGFAICRIAFFTNRKR